MDQLVPDLAIRL